MVGTDTNILMIDIPDAIKLNRLLQLCSANLPVGGFSFSQGLEYAVEAGWIDDALSTHNWIAFNLTEAFAGTDLAVLKRLYVSLEKQDLDDFRYWNQHLIACRESHELHLADIAMGKALMRLLNGLEGVDTNLYRRVFDVAEISFVSAFSLAARLFNLDSYTAQSGFCWTYIDNQVAAATKLVPLGQTQAQNLLFDLTTLVADAVAQANQLRDEDIGFSLPRLAMASAWHETQYSRLFRS